MADKKKEEKDIQGLSEDINRMSAEVTKTLDKQTEEIKRFGKTTEETGKELEKLHKEWGEKQAELTALKERVDTFEKRMARPDFGSGRGERKTLGQHFIESQAFKDFLDTPGAVQSNVAEIEFKTLMSTGSGDALIPNFIDPDIVEYDRARALVLESLLNILNIDSNAVTYMKQSARYILKTTLAESVSSSDTEFTPTSIAGFMPGAEAVVGGEEVTISAVNTSTGVVTCSAFAAGHLAGVDITSDRFTYTPECELIPAGSIEFTDVSEGVKTLSRYIPVSDDMLQDHPQIQSLINLDLMRALQEEREDQLFYGAGGSKQLQGMMTNSESPTYSMSTVVGDNRLDAIRRSLTLLGISRYQPNGVILNPTDKEKIDLLKGGDGHYMFVQLLLAGGVNSIQQVPLIQSGGIRAGDFLAGDYKIAATLFRRSNVRIQVGEVNDDFLKGKKAIKAAVREAYAIKRADAIIRGSFS